eukprot:scaffold130963_cov55-Attheya_sp.AAC.3
MTRRGSTIRSHQESGSHQRTEHITRAIAIPMLANLMIKITWGRSFSSCRARADDSGAAAGSGASAIGASGGGAAAPPPFSLVSHDGASDMIEFEMKRRLDKEPDETVEEWPLNDGPRLCVVSKWAEEQKIKSTFFYELETGTRVGTKPNTEVPNTTSSQHILSRSRSSFASRSQAPNNICFDIQKSNGILNE